MRCVGLLAAVMVMAVSGMARAQGEDLIAEEAIAEKALSEVQMASVVGDIEEGAQEATASQWIWGEVASVDFVGNSLVLKHLDYETAEEVAKTLQVDDKTVFQGVMGLADLEVGMHVTIDYKEKDGRCVADVIEVETGTAP